MQHLLALAALSITLVASGCASSGVLLDDAPISQLDSYVLVRPHCLIGGLSYEKVDIELARVEANGHQSTEFYRGISTVAPTILKLRPGFYYLKSASALTGYYRFAFHPRLTLFEVRSSQLNYPGDWLVRQTFFDSRVDGTLGSGFARSSSQSELVVLQDANIHNVLRQRFPAVAAKMTPVYTKVGIPDADAQPSKQ